VRSSQVFQNHLGLHLHVLSPSANQYACHQVVVRDLPGNDGRLFGQVDIVGQQARGTQPDVEGLIGIVDTRPKIRDVLALQTHWDGRDPPPSAPWPPVGQNQPETRRTEVDKPDAEASAPPQIEAVGVGDVCRVALGRADRVPGDMLAPRPIPRLVSGILKVSSCDCGAPSSPAHCCR
jgi:hypothetical protein